MKKTKYIVFIVTLLVWFASCFHVHASEAIHFEFPKWVRSKGKIPREIEREKRDGEEYVILLSSNNSYDPYPIYSNGMKVTLLIYHSDKKRRIRCVLTSDPSCATSEGVSPGLKYRDIKDFASGSPEYFPGWGYYWVLPSGWVASFGYIEGGGDPITDDAIVGSLIVYGDYSSFSDLKLFKSTESIDRGCPNSC